MGGEYWIWQQALKAWERYGFLGALGVFLAFGLAGVFIHWVRARVQEKQDLQERLFNELKQERALNHTLMTNHIQHINSRQEADARFQAKMIEAQNKTASIQEATERRLEALQSEIRGGFQDAERRDQATALQLTRIEGRIDGLAQ